MLSGGGGAAAVEGGEHGRVAAAEVGDAGDGAGRAFGDDQVCVAGPGDVAGWGVLLFASAVDGGWGCEDGTAGGGRCAVRHRISVLFVAGYAGGELLVERDEF